jgi:hypothetical protein
MVQYTLRSTPLLPFKYLGASACDRLNGIIGTTFRVYLKSEFANGSTRLDVESLARYYCRHVPDLYIVADAVKFLLESDWNFSAGVYYGERTEEYEVRVSWASDGYDSIKLSNGGFYVCDLDWDILGDFPKGLMSGEINISPGLVDLNLSRDGIVRNEKIQVLLTVIGHSLSELIEKTYIEVTTNYKYLTEADIMRIKSGANGLMRACLILNKVLENGHVGRIPLTTSRDVINYYEPMLIADIACKALGKEYNMLSDLKKKILDHQIIIIVEPKSEKLNSAYPTNILKNKYLNYDLVSNITIQLSNRQIVTGPGPLGRVAEVRGADLERLDFELSKRKIRRFSLELGETWLFCWEIVKAAFFIWAAYKLTSYIPGLHGLIASHLPESALVRYLFGP